MSVLGGFKTPQQYHDAIRRNHKMDDIQTYKTDDGSLIGVPITLENVTNLFFPSMENCEIVRKNFQDSGQLAGKDLE
jgi:hypothetical protein